MTGLDGLLLPEGVLHLVDEVEHISEEMDKNSKKSNDGVPLT